MWDNRDLLFVGLTNIGQALLDGIKNFMIVRLIMYICSKNIYLLI
jgi:hypothetical protein